MSRFPNLRRYLRVGALSLIIGGTAAGTKFYCNYKSQRPIPNIYDRSAHLPKEQRWKIRGIEERIRSLKTWVLHDKDMNLKRIEISKLYLQLARMDFKNEIFYQELALAEIDGADRISDANVRYHSRAMYVRDYFEVLMQIGAVHFAMRNYPKAISIYKRIHKELGDRGMLLAQQVHDYSVPGYKNRTNLELAQVYLQQGRYAQAKPLLAEVRSWASSQTGRSSLVRWYINTKIKDLHYLEAKSSVGLGLVAITEGNYSAAISNFKTVLNKPESGDKDGFMDLGFEALTYTMVACLDSTNGDVRKAKLKFRRMLPWKRIQGYGDLIKSLKLSDIDLTDRNIDVWDAILQGLQQVNLSSKGQSLLQRVRLQTMHEISGGK